MRRLHVCGIAGLLAGAVTLAVGAPAAAHDGDAVIAVDQTHPATGQVHFILQLEYDDDGHPVEGATVTATATGPSGGDEEVIELVEEGEPGTYQGALDMPEPGDWTVRFTSENPAGELEHTQTVEGEAGGEEPPAPPEEEAVPEGDAEADPEPAAQPEDEAEEDDDDGVPIFVPIFIGVFLVAVVAVVLWGTSGRRTDEARRAAPAAPEPEPVTTPSPTPAPEPPASDVPPSGSPPQL